jgi:hypothetical protein
MLPDMSEWSAGADFVMADSQDHINLAAGFITQQKHPMER